MKKQEVSEKWMEVALAEAEKAAQRGEVPVGAAAVLRDQLIASDHNRSVQLCDPTAHAEILVLRAAGLKLSNYRLPLLQVYVTIEPCCMCAGALVWARISHLIYGAADPKAGAVSSKARLLEPGLFNHTVSLTAGVLEPPCRSLMQEFFRARRSR